MRACTHTDAEGDRGQQVTVTGEVTYLHSSSVHRTIIVHLKHWGVRASLLFASRCYY